jgi:hypothetical protein
MLYTSLRVIHQTDRFTVTKFGKPGGALAVVIEELDPRSHETVGALAFGGLDALSVLDEMGKVIRREAESFAPTKPFGVDELLSRYFM